MVWLPDHIWEAQKAAKAAKGGAKGSTKKKGKNDWGGGQDWQNMFYMMMSNPAQQQAFMQMMGAASQPEASGGSQAKMFLMQFVREKTGETPTKDQVAYTTTEVEGSKPTQFKSEVILLSIDPNKSYKGKAAPSKKAAEMSAAEAALRQNGKGALLKGGGAVAKKKGAKAVTEGPKRKSSGIDINKVDADKKVWVGNLPKDKDSWKELNELCKTIGNVEGVERLGKKTQSCVVFSTAEEATMAIAQLQGSMVGGSAIEVDVWNKKQK